MKTLGKDYVFSGHAKEQMLKRGIAIEWVEKALIEPDAVFEDHGTQIYHLLLSEKQLLRVIVNVVVNPNLVVTTYITSKIKKYHEGKI